MKTFDPELLRTFLAFLDSGSLSRAAEIVGRTPSAVTAQMQRLEETVGERLLAADGRGRIPTPAGLALADHARRILDAHREAWLGLKGAQADGRLSLGTTQDIAESVLPDLLRRFRRSHPRLRLELRIGRSQELIRSFEEGSLDVTLTLKASSGSSPFFTVDEPMIWLVPSELAAAPPPDEVPLALLDPPCAFRSAAIAALERANRPYQLVATSASLSGVKVALEAGMALTLRTARMRDGNIVPAPSHWALPQVPMAQFAIHRRDTLPGPAAVLCELLQEALTTSP